MKAESDLITERQLDRVQSVLRKVFLTQLAVAASVGITFSVVAVLVGYVLGADQKQFPPVAVVAGIIIAALMALDRWKTYRFERKAIAEIRRRVREGEFVYASSFSIPKRAQHPHARDVRNARA